MSRLLMASNRLSGFIAKELLALTPDRRHVGVMSFFSIAIRQCGITFARHAVCDRFPSYAGLASNQSRDQSVAGLDTICVETPNSLRAMRSLHGERFVMATYAVQMYSCVLMQMEMGAIVIIRVIASPGHIVVTIGLPQIQVEVLAAARWLD
jgi:hypothetical protein